MREPSPEIIAEEAVNDCSKSIAQKNGSGLEQSNVNRMISTFDNLKKNAVGTTSINYVDPNPPPQSRISSLFNLP